jgi:Pentapeptide repeats (8 copies)
MLSRRNREPPPSKTEPTPFAAKAKDLGALRDAVVDAAGVGTGLWLSYLFVLIYFAIAAGAVTHRDLLLENPVKLPFLNVELPLKAFFILGPLVFLIVHAYVLLHFVLLAGKIAAFQTELEAQIGRDNVKTEVRRQLPSNIFVQSLAGPRDVREGPIGALLWLIIGISLVAGPIALLLLFQLQFLPYHSEPITMWQRIAVVIDLALLWTLWPSIASGETTHLTSRDFRRPKVLSWLAASTLPVLLAVAIATFPGEWLERNLPSLQLVPASWKANRPDAKWATLHELLVAGNVNFVTDSPKSLWSNVLVLPDFKAGDRVKFDAEGKIAIGSDALSSRDRYLQGAVFVRAHLDKADFTGAQLQDATFSVADLSEAKFKCDIVGAEPKCAQLRGADLRIAQLQGANLGHVFVWRTRAPDQQQMSGALIDTPERGAKYLVGFGCAAEPPKVCYWTETTYAALKSLIESSVPAGGIRDATLNRIAKLEKPPYVPDQTSAQAWINLAEVSRKAAADPDTLAKMQIGIGCAPTEPPT